MHTGRKTKSPKSRLGIFVQTHLDRLEMKRSDLAKLLGVSPPTIGRFINGDTKTVKLISGKDICKALSLSEKNQQELLTLIKDAQEAFLAPIPEISMTNVRGEHPVHRGRRVKIPTTPLGSFLQERLQAGNITRAELAKRLRVSSSTVSRLLNGDTKVVQRVSAEGICNAMRFDTMHRRAFLELVGSVSLGTFALATGVTSPTILKYKIDLDETAQQIALLKSRLRQKDQSVLVLQEARSLYKQLIHISPYRKDQYLAAIQLRCGLLLGDVQETVCPSYQRPTAAIQIYNDLEERILPQFPLDTFPNEYATLHVYRSQLYRRRGLVELSLEGFEDGICYARRTGAAGLLSALLRKRLITWAIQGDMVRWQRGLIETQRAVHELDSAHQELYLGLVTATEASSYIHFSCQFPLTRLERVDYAKRALDYFAQSRKATRQLDIVGQLYIVFDEAKCWIWTDPEKAIDLAEQAKNMAASFFPTLLEKINRFLAFAQRRL